jgi:2-dehydropantoate 2-reductase
MRFLIVGAGAVGGYFGGRLLQAGQDVTFLVRPRRAAQLRRTGLVIKGPNGDATLPNPPLVQADGLEAPFDAVILSCKAYDLDRALEAMAPAVGPDTAILPLLNGLRHLDVLDRRFGAARVLGGQCAIATTLDPDGAILQLAPMQTLSFGERADGTSARVEAIAAAMQGANFESRASARILQEMWEKWQMLATLAGSTCLMRASIGDIVAAPGGEAFVLGLIEEVASIATAAGNPPSPAFATRIRGMLTAPGSPLTASMFRDIERGAPIEADHIIGDLISRGAQEQGEAALPGLRLVYTHLKAYEARLARQPS